MHMLAYFAVQMYQFPQKDNHQSNLLSRSLHRFYNGAKMVLRMIYDAVSGFFMSIYYRLFQRTTVTFTQRNRNGITVSILPSNIIGEGAYSVVYKSKPYAVKKVLMQDAEAEKIFDTELTALKTFQHLGIVRLLDYTKEWESGVHIGYFLFPLYREGSLRNKLDAVLAGKAPKPGITTVLSQFAQICDALNTLHSHNPSFVHQDIKPENVILDGSTCVLIDFGSVRTANVKINTRLQAITVAEDAAQLCTVSYRSPELFDPKTGMSLDCRTDVWAMGCLLFAWWFGYSPFECAFHGGELKVTECNLLRVLAPMPTITNASRDDQIILDLAEFVLIKEIQDRPFLPEVVQKVEGAMRSLTSSGVSSSYDPFTGNSSSPFLPSDSNV